MSNYDFLIDFFSLSLKVECVTVGGLKREFHVAVALTLPLHGSAVSRLAIKETTFLGTCKVFEWELNLFLSLHVVAAPHFNYLRLFP